jgi:tripartite-type tricarboxylate transporter receptor subunit TctC
VFARLIAQRLGPTIGGDAIAENRPGAGGAIAAKYVAGAAADGHTLLLGNTSTLATIPAFAKTPDYDPVKAFAPVASVADSFSVLSVRSDSPISSVKELIAYAKANPGKLNFGSSGAGSAPHLAAELFASMAGVKMVHVPYKGSGESQAATLAGHVDLTFFAFSTALRHTKAGKLRALGVGGTKRNPQAPDVPSISEVLPGYSAASWTALFAPPDTPAPVVQRLTAAAAEIVKMPDVQKRMIDAGDESVEMTSAQMADFLREERQRWSTLITALGLKAQ